MAVLRGHPNDEPKLAAFVALLVILCVLAFIIGRATGEELDKLLPPLESCAPEPCGVLANYGCDLGQLTEYVTGCEAGYWRVYVWAAYDDPLTLQREEKRKWGFMYSCRKSEDDAWKDCKEFRKRCAKMLKEVMDGREKEKRRCKGNAAQSGPE